MPVWFNETVLTIFFSVVFLVFYAIAYSVLRGLVDNYYKYAQKADLQWTGPGRGAARKGVPFVAIAILSVITAWLVVRFLIF